MEPVKPKKGNGVGKIKRIRKKDIHRINPEAISFRNISIRKCTVQIRLFTLLNNTSSRKYKDKSKKKISMNMKEKK